MKKLTHVSEKPAALPCLREGTGCVSLAVKLTPRARKNALLGFTGDKLKIALTAPPVDGKANEALIAFLAGLLRLPKGAIEITRGHTGRDKLIALRGADIGEVQSALRRELGLG